MSAVGHRRRIASTASRMFALAWKGVAIVPSSRIPPGESGCPGRDPLVLVPGRIPFRVQQPDGAAF